MFRKIFTAQSNIFLLQKNKNIMRNYYSPTKTETPKNITYPFCMDCRYYIPMEHSPLFPNSACKYFPQLKPCTAVRANENLCGKEGVHYFPRINPCKCKK